MPPRGPGLSRKLTAALSLSGLVALAACASQGPVAHRAVATPASLATTPVTEPLATHTPPKPRPKARSTAPATDSLGAHRVIAVPRSVAQQQEHRIVPVDGQAVFLDSEAGSQPRPLVLVLAGLGEDAVTMRNGTGFTALGALAGFDVAYPEAPQDPATPTAPPAAQTVHAAALHATAVHATTVRATTVHATTVHATAVQATTVHPRTAAVVNQNRPTSSPAAGNSRAAASPQADNTPTASPPGSAAQSPTSTPSSSPSRPTPTPPASPKPTASPTRKPSPTPTPHQTQTTPAERPSPLSPGTRAWNAGGCCAPTTRDDVRYLVDVVHSVAASVPVDASRVYVVGFSNGGMMALDAVCSAPSVFAAAGSVAGPFLGSHCARPVWRHLAAAPDTVVPTGGGIPAGLPEMGIVRDWCGCAFPATTTEAARFGQFASVVIAPNGGHFWPTPTTIGWSYDPERDLWGYVSKFSL